MQNKWFGKIKKGFTLAEVLIVIAIIGVLVAVSIPVFSLQLEKSRERTDIASLRAAMSAGVAKYLENKNNAGNYIYDINTGKLFNTSEAPSEGYGKGTGKDGKSDPFKMSTNTASTTMYRPTDDVKGKRIHVQIASTGDVTLSWGS